MLHGDLPATRVGLLVPKRRVNSESCRTERQKLSEGGLRETEIYITWRNGGFARSRFVWSFWLYRRWSAMEWLEYVEIVARFSRVLHV
jgi:hypothetical protein